MSKKLNSERAKQIYAQIARERQELKHSLDEASESISSIKDSTVEITKNPLSLFFSRDSALGKVSLDKISISEIVSEKPLQTVAAFFSVGLLAAFAAKKMKPDWKNLLTKSAKFVATSEFYEKAKVKFADMSGEFIDNLLASTAKPESEKEKYDLLH